MNKKWTRVVREEIPLALHHRMKMLARNRVLPIWEMHMVADDSLITALTSVYCQGLADGEEVARRRQGEQS